MQDLAARDCAADFAADLLPKSFTTPIASRLLRTTPETLASLTRSGAIQALPGESWNRYSRTEIERLLGHPITLAEWVEASRSHEPRREANRRYNSKRRAIER
jgi:hypothetical protein